jgi:TolB-like protein
MPSLIPDFAYDIFISYRQKDNKYDGWVTEFVDNLKRELEATFKEDISVYFDINPHDGLLETHDVDASLKEKLKCLIFIPIISQTYCDSKSFAWEHEFVAFNKSAKEDQFGRDVRLAGGNVASRILPVKIHDLDPEDKKLIEDELGTVLRGIEFIYREAGVNRPLKPNDDTKENLNKTNYRNQVNKVANAVKEIINAIKKYDQETVEDQAVVVKTKTQKQKKVIIRIIVPAVLLLLLAVAGYFLILKLIKPAEATEKSIAVLPFKSLSDDPEKQYLADGVMDAVLLHLQKFKELSVRARTSVEQYRGTTKTASVIGKELGVEYLLEGSFQKVGDNVKLIVKLINVKVENPVWANEYDKNWKDIFAVQTEVAQSIAKELYANITPEEKILTERIPTTNLTAYDLYLKSKYYEGKYWATNNLDFYQKAISLLNSALELDSTFSRAYSSLAINYFNRYKNDFYKEGVSDSCLLLANMSLSLDDQNDEAYYINGMCYYQIGKTEDALDNYDKAIKINPYYFRVYYFKGNLFLNKGNYVKAIENSELTVKYCPLNEIKGWKLALGYCYLNTGFFDKARFYFQEKLAQDGNNKLDSLGKICSIELYSENFDKALKLSNELNEIAPSNFQHITSRLWLYTYIPGNNDEALTLTNKLIELIKTNPRHGTLDDFADWIGYFFWQAGNIKEARYYLDQKIKYCEAKIKLAKGFDAGNYYISLATIYAFQGDNINAYRYLDELDKSGFYNLLVLLDLRHSSLFAGISNEARFQQILQNMETRYRAEHERARKWLEEQGKL